MPNIVPTPFDTLPTPAVILDKQRLEANCRRMAERARTAKVKLRPHLKTAKCADVARIATAGQFGGITVSTIAELEYFFEAGFTDLTYAVGIVRSKMDAIERLMARGARIQIVVDSIDAIAELAERDAAQSAPRKAAVPVLIEIDCGGHRAGVTPDSEELIDIAKQIAATPSLELAGVLTHAGHSYHANTETARREIAIVERDAALLAAQRLRDAGFVVETVSIGSTPTALTDIPLDGITEIRPGVYVFFDLSQAHLGVCSVDDIAVSVLATVISHRREAGHLLIDAGALALSKDVSANEFQPHIGYGLVCDEAGKPIPGLYVAEVHQEHGFVKSTNGTVQFEQLPIGSRVRILPNHACMTVAPYREYQVVEQGNPQLAIWAKTTGW
jgi:D-serine deaminase-like pyridoxal phosphate-dependent protein